MSKILYALLVVVVGSLVLGVAHEPRAGVSLGVGDEIPVAGDALGGPLPEAVVIAAALNDLKPTDGGVRLTHPRHEVTFTATGVAMAPRRGGPAWQWELVDVEAGGAPVVAVPATDVAPTLTGRVVVYDRGGMIEQYVPRAATVEQQFVLPARLDLDGADLAIGGRVTSPGAFEATGAGWQWATADGAVTLGDVTVFDANGARLPATLAVSAETTQIVVDGAALESASYPVTVDPEVGTNDSNTNCWPRAEPRPCRLR